MLPTMRFRTAEEELQFLRGVVRVSQMADEILEDCLSRQMGLSAAVDVFLTQTARMIHARAGFVMLRGSEGPVLTRVLGNPGVDVRVAAAWDGAVQVADGMVMFVTQLNLGHVNLGALGMLIESVGINPEASRLAGVKARSIIWTVYAVCALFAGLAGLMISSSTSIAPRSRHSRCTRLR